MYTWISSELFVRILVILVVTLVSEGCLRIAQPIITPSNAVDAPLGPGLYTLRGQSDSFLDLTGTFRPSNIEHEYVFQLLALKAGNEADQADVDKDEPRVREIFSRFRFSFAVLQKDTYLVQWISKSRNGETRFVGGTGVFRTQVLIIKKTGPETAQIFAFGTHLSGNEYEVPASLLQKYSVTQKCITEDKDPLSLPCPGLRGDPSNIIALIKELMLTEIDQVYEVN